MQHPACSQTGFQAIGRDGGATVIFAIVLAPNWIGERSQAKSAGPVDDTGQQRWCAHALVVIADETMSALRN